MNQVRIHGDPFGDDAEAGLLRSFLRLALASGVQCALSLTAVQGRAAGVGEREIPLTDGVRELRVGTRLPPADVDMLLRASGQPVAATAPVVVFAPAERRTDVQRLAALEWPEATAVIAAREGHRAADLLDRIRAEIRWAGTEHPAHSLELRDLQSWLALPPSDDRGPVVYVGGVDRLAGLDLAVTAWLRHGSPDVHGFRAVVPAADVRAAAACVADLAGDAVVHTEVVAGPFEPAHVRDAAAILLPWRSAWDPRALVLALASGRPVCASRGSCTVSIVGRAGICLPIGGREMPSEADTDRSFAPKPAAIGAALRQALRDRAAATVTGRRAREHVVEHLVRSRPAAPPAPVHDVRSPRPTVVLEAPLFETSSSAELSIETARALVQRGAVDLFLRPSTPFRHDLAWLRRRAPDLERHLVRQPGTVDLWLSSGWPVRADRPPCRMHALRIDWEYGALPLESTPHVDQTADLVVVHSEYVYRMLTAAGRPMSSIRLIPHGVDAAVHEHAEPDPEIVAWKGSRPAVLFCGGMIWRKGFDAFLAAVLGAYAQRQDFVVVVKSVGHDQHYGRFHLGALVERFQRTAGAPPIRLVDGELTRAGLASLYTACDVLLHPYRGEGFGLTVLEARAAGLPVIATAGGACDVLLTGPGAQLIPSARREVELPGAHVSAPWVLEPSVADAARLLRETLDQLPRHRRDARRVAPALRCAFSWDAAAAGVEQIAFTAMSRRANSTGRTLVDERVVRLPAAPVARVDHREPVSS